MKILVTGGGGFLGQALCRGLVERGHEVASFNRSHYPALDALGVRQLRGDLADAQAVCDAARGMQAIFHNAAKAGAWGSRESYFRANVLGTRNVLAACRAHGVARLVYTSTPSVTHRKTHPVEGGTADTVPYGEGFKAPYAATKAIAEQEVLAANGELLADGARLATVALRPRLIWGPGDQQILPRLVERANTEATGPLISLAWSRSWIIWSSTSPPEAASSKNHGASGAALIRRNRLTATFPTAPADTAAWAAAYCGK